MAKMNQEAVLKRAQAAMSSEAVQQKIEKVVDARVASGGSPPSRAAESFIRILKNEIESSAGASASSGQLGATAVSALLDIDYQKPYKIGRNLYQIDVSFTRDLSRDSLDPSYWDGIENIAKLLNSGYTVSGGRQFGVWLHGNSPFNIPSLTSRAGAHFVDNAIRIFMDGYASVYGVIDIKTDYLN